MNHGIVQSNPTNDPKSKPVHSRSKFKPSMSLYQSLLFGLCTPSFAMEVVPDDERVSVRCTTDLDTMSLKAPLLGPVNMHRDYFYVPLRAILRENADLLVTNPLTGGDINADDVNAILRLDSTSGQWYARLSNVISSLNSQLNMSTVNGTNASKFVAAVTFIYSFLAPIFSDASLLNAVGISLNKLVNFDYVASPSKRLSFDEGLERMLAWINTNVVNFNVYLYELTENGISEAQYIVYVNEDIHEATTSHLNLRLLLEKLRDGAVVSYISTCTLVTGATKPTANGTPGGNPFALKLANANSLHTFRNIQRLVAYQLACAQFYTSDSVDYVYTTQLWHQNMNSIVANLRSTAAAPLIPSSYVLNGVQIPYDCVSSAILNAVLANLMNVVAISARYDDESIVQGYGWSSDFNAQTLVYSMSYFNNLFQAQRSLKYRDYFVGCKPRPMAVGDVNVAVSNSQVNVVDVTKNIQMQRFLNQVNRVGRTLKEYSRGIFGQSPMIDPRECVWLGSTSDAIGAEETQNTGADQLTQPQTITSKLRMNSSRFAFEFDVAEFGIVVAITTFDIPRPYLNVTDRACFHVNRFDMFNPFMQNIGDQPVYREELDPTLTGNFGYAIRYSEYHQRVSRAVGGFRNFLPGYAFTADDEELGVINGSVVISPDFIRSRPFELDRFYIALPNFSPAGYFHFITRQDYEVTANRPMEAAPSIL